MRASRRLANSPIRPPIYTADTGDNVSGRGGKGDLERVFLDLDLVPWGIKELYGRVSQ